MTRSCMSAARSSHRGTDSRNISVTMTIRLLGRSMSSQSVSAAEMRRLPVGVIELPAVRQVCGACTTTLRPDGTTRPVAMVPTLRVGGRWGRPGAGRRSRCRAADCGVTLYIDGCRCAELAMTDAQVREQVRAHYAQAATAVLAASGRTTLPIVDAQCCAPAAAGDEVATCCGGDAEVGVVFGPDLYSAAEQGELPAAAVAASLGCGNPMMVAELREGERVLDLGSGGGIDVLLSARRVGERGFAYGVDMTDEMLTLARANAAKA